MVPSFKEFKVLSTEKIAEWMKPIVQYLEGGILPDDKFQAMKLRRKAAYYALHKGSLYRRSVTHQ